MVSSDERGDLADQVEQLVAQVQPQRDPHRLAPRPAGVQPARVVTDSLDEEALTAVVRLAERRVVREVLGAVG